MLQRLIETPKEFDLYLECRNGHVIDSLLCLFLIRFLAYRRCAIFSTVIVTYFATGEKPGETEAITAVLVTVGALIAGYETIECNLIGFVLTWTNNFSQSL